MKTRTISTPEFQRMLTKKPRTKRSRGANLGRVYTRLDREKKLVVDGATWNHVSNTIAHFRRKGVTTHSHKVADSKWVMWVE